MNSYFLLNVGAFRVQARIVDMDGAIVGAAILPLIGVAMGTAGTLAGQYLAVRAESRRHADQRAAAARAERKEAIVGLLDAVQRVEQVVDHRMRGGPSDETLVDERLHAMWLSKKLLELVCSPSLASVAHRYVSTLHSLASSSTTGSTARHNEHRAEFMEAARDELGIDGSRLYPATGDGSDPQPSSTG